MRVCVRLKVWVAGAFLRVKLWLSKLLLLRRAQVLEASSSEVRMLFVRLVLVWLCGFCERFPSSPPPPSCSFSGGSLSFLRI